MYSIKNEKGEFYTVQFNKMTFTKNPNFRYLIEANKIQGMLNFLKNHFNNENLTISK